MRYVPGTSNIRYWLGKTAFDVAGSRAHIVAVVAFCGVAAALLDYISYAAVRQTGTLKSVQFLAAAVVLGLAVAAVALLVLLGIRERRRRLLEDVRKIRELNHHVRNALEVVLYSQYVPPSEEQRRAVLASIERIDRTLRHLFPLGEGQNGFGPRPPGRVSGSPRNTAGQAMLLML
jgi:uncharacterized membrane protein YbhN (UPF0104 family)